MAVALGKKSVGKKPHELDQRTGASVSQAFRGMVGLQKWRFWHGEVSGI
jgi:hypothetical protein